MAENGYLSDLLKNLAIGSSNVATGFVGAPGTAISSLSALGKTGLEYLNPPEIEELYEKQGLGFLSPTKTTQPLANLLGGISSFFEPTSGESIQQDLENLTGGYLKPTTPTQETVKEYGQDIGTFLAPGGQIKPAIKAATLGGVAKQVSKLSGGSESTQNYAKLLGMMSSPVFKFNNIKPMYKELYKDAENALVKPGTKGILQSKSIKDGASNVYKKTLEGTGSTTAKSAARKMAKGSLLKLKKPYISVKEVWEMNKDINNELAKMGKYQDQKAFFLRPLREAINDKLSLYGKRNKDFGNAFTNAQTLFGIEKGLPLLDKVVNKAIGLKDTGLSEYFRKSLAYGMGGIKGLLTKSALGSLSKRGEAFLKSPVYRKASIELAKGTMKNSSPIVLKSLKKLTKIHKQFENELTNKRGQRFKIINVNNMEKQEPINLEVDKSTGLRPGFKVISKEELAAMMK